MRTVSVKSAARILDILELLAGMRGAIGVSELARRLDLPKSSTSALVATLAGRGYVTSTPDGVALAECYRGGGWVGGGTARLIREAGKAMHQLSVETGESSFLGVATPEFDVQYVEKVVSANPLRYDADLSMVRPAYCTTIGLVLLAGLAPDRLDDYLAGRTLHRLTSRTITDQAVLRAEIEKTRQRGFATMSDSHVMGTTGVSAPVVENEQVVAGLAVIAPSERFSLQSERIVKATVDAAELLGQVLNQ